MTHLCVAIFVHDIAQAKRDIAAAAEAGADMVELRVDSFDDEAGLRELIERAVLPCIVTRRPSWEGGHCELPEDQRRGLYQSTAVFGAAYLDIELETYKQMPEAEKDKILRPFILSKHDFAGRPPTLS